MTARGSGTKGTVAAVREFTGTERILLVDDDEMVLPFFKAGLELLGYRVTAFLDSPAALAAFERTPDEFDLVFTDIDMPDVDGFDLARVVRAIRPAVPIVLCTGVYMLVDTEVMRELGLTTVLQKPVGHKDLARAVRSELDRAAVR